MRSLDGGLHVASLKDDVGALSPQLKGDPLQVGRGLRLDDLPDLGGAGEGHLVDVGVAGDGGAGRRAEPGDDVDDARGETGLLDQLSHVETGQRRLKCRSIPLSINEFVIRKKCQGIIPQMLRLLAGGRLM